MSPVRNSKEYGNNIPTGFRQEFHVEKMRSRFKLSLKNFRMKKYIGKRKFYTSPNNARVIPLEC